MKKLTVLLCLFSSIAFFLFGCQKQQPKEIPITNNPITENSDSERGTTEENTEKIPEQTTEIESETKKNKKTVDVNVGDTIYDENGISITYTGITYDEFLGNTEEVLSFIVSNNSSDNRCVEFYEGDTTHLWEVEAKNKTKVTIKTAELNLSELVVSISQKDDSQSRVGTGTARKLMKINFIKQEPELKTLYENDDLLIERIDVVPNVNSASLFIKVSAKEHQTYLRISNLTINAVPYEPTAINILPDDSVSDGETTLIAYPDKINSMKIPFFDNIEEGTTITGTLSFSINYKFMDVENDTEKTINILTVVSENFTD